MSNEIIGIVLVVALVVVALLVRGVLSASRRERSPLSAVGPNSQATLTAPGPAGRGPLVTSAFGSAPVWAGGPLAGSPMDIPQAADRVQAGKPPPFPTRLTPPHTRDPDPRKEATIDGRPSGEQSHAQIMTVPGNLAHASRVMHVSSLRSAVAREMPTSWMVVTPMDLLGDAPPHEHRSEPADAAEGVAVAPPSVDEPVTESVPGPVGSDEAGRAASPELEGVMAAPNPFEPTTARPPKGHLGMPAGLLSDLLGSEEDPLGSEVLTRSEDLTRTR